MDTGASGEIGQVARDAPSMQVITSPEVKHTEEDTEEWVPAAGLEQVGRAYARIIDEINAVTRRDLVAGLRRPNRPRTALTRRASSMPPLDGLKVIDLTRVLAGPFCTMLLGDMGADIIKVEEPSAATTPGAGRLFIDGWSSYFLGVNRNKRSIALDIKSPPGAGAPAALLRDADVLVENLRPGTLARLGFGYEPVSAINPRLIYASVSGYGHPGPRRDEAGYDPCCRPRPV